MDGQFPGEIRWIQGRTQAVFDGWVCSAAGEKKRAFIFAPVQEAGAANEAAARRKLRHELGIDPAQLPHDDFRFLTRFHYWAADTLTYGEAPPWGEHEVDYILLATADVECSLNPNEVSEIRYLAKEELSELLAQEHRNEIMLSPWFKAVAQKWLPMWWDALLEGKIDSVKDTTTIHILS